MKTIRKIALATAISASALVAMPASANVPVIDPTSIARIREVVTKAQEQIAVAQQGVEQAKQMRNTIGQIGPGTLNTLLENSGLNFQNPTGAFKDIGSVAAQVDSIGQQASQFTIPGEGSISVGKIDSLSTGREAAAKLFYYNSSEPLTQSVVSDLRQRRNTMLRESATTGYGLAQTTKSDLLNTQQVADKLSQQAAGAVDLRGDVQAGTAVLLAMYSEMAKQTAVQAQLLDLESSRTLAADATGRRGE